MSASGGASAFVAAALGLCGLVHLLPLGGVLGAAPLVALYGAAAGEPGVALLLRHRALGFGTLALFCLAAAWHPPWRLPALGLALASVAGFLLLAGAPGGLGEALRRVYWVDALLLPLLLAALALQLRATTK